VADSAKSTVAVLETELDFFLPKFRLIISAVSDNTNAALVHVLFDHEHEKNQMVLTPPNLSPYREHTFKKLRPKISYYCPFNLF
jgi:hypothetical protein